MTNQITVLGMVLQAAPIGEYDRRIVILTRERGKISVFAKGSRRQGSHLMGITSPFAFGEFTLYEGRSSYTLASANISNYFSDLRMDIEGAYYGMYFMELASYYGREANDETELLKLLYQTMRALTNPKIPNRLIRAVYELKIVTINGEGPQVFECAGCGTTEKELLFSVRRGGLVCENCGRHLTDRRKLLPPTLYTLQYVVSTKVERVYSFLVKDDVLLELEDLMAEYLDIYVGRKFKSLEILKTIVD